MGVLQVPLLALALSALPCRDVELWSERPLDRAAVSSTWGPLGEDLKDPSSKELRTQLESRCELAQRPRGTALPGHTGPSITSVLARPEFVKNRGSINPMNGRVILFLRWLASLLRTEGAMSYAEGTRFVVLLVAAGVALYGAYRVFRRRYVRESRRVAQVQAEPLQLEAPVAHLERARALAASSPRAALRESMLALLSMLERRRWARPDRVKTNHELVKELHTRGAPEDARAALTPLIAGYDHAFYSLEPVTTDAAMAFLGEVTRAEERWGTPA